MHGPSSPKSPGEEFWLPIMSIFRDGDEADHYFSITSGIVKLVKTLADGHQHIIGLIHQPGFMGQTLNRRHTYAAESATGVELCSYPRAAFDAFLKTHPELERQIFQMTIRELDVCRDWTLLLGRKCSYERVAGFLLMMARRMPKAAEEVTEFRSLRAAVHPRRDGRLSRPHPRNRKPPVQPAEEETHHRPAVEPRYYNPRHRAPERRRPNRKLLRRF